MKIKQYFEYLLYIGVILPENKEQMKIKIQNFIKEKSEKKKGIADILRDTIETENKKILEFDIDKLNNKKLKQLDEYVKNCIKENNANQKLDINVEKLKQDLTDINQMDNNNDNNEKDIEKDSLSDSDSSISDSYLNKIYINERKKQRRKRRQER